MTSLEPPKLETRSSNEIVDYVAERVQLRIDGSDPLGEGLIKVFARYFELISERLNRVPEKHRLAFLELLGTKPFPPTPAGVPLTFFPVKQLAQLEQADTEAAAVRVRAVVPARAQVSAASADEEGEPIVFETERPLELTSATLERVVAADPLRDSIADYTELAAGATPGIRLFADRMQPARHEFYITKPDVFGEDISSVTLHFDIVAGTEGEERNQVVKWTLPGKPLDIPLSPSRDSTWGITKSGDVTFLELPKWPQYTLGGIEGNWLRCTLVSGPARRTVSRSDDGQERPSIIRRIEIAGRFEAIDRGLERGFFNAQPLDVTTGFRPFGSNPRFGDLFYLGSQLFAKADTSVVLKIHIVRPVSDTGAPSTPATILVDRHHLIWEALTAGRWVALDCDDDTRGLMESGTVRFRLPAFVGPVAVNGIETGWIRARFTGGDHLGRDSIEKLLTDPGKQPPGHPIPWPAVAPTIESITIDASKAFGRLPVDRIVTADDFDIATVEFHGARAIEPFRRVSWDENALYLGFAAAEGTKENRTLSLYIFVNEPSGRLASNAEPRRRRTLARCEHWDGDAWMPATIADETNAFNESGSVVLGFGPRVRVSSGPTSRRLHWVRFPWPADQAPATGVVERIAVNTVAAINAVTSENELLGSSNNTPNQIFRCARAPVLGAIKLEVRELDLPSADEVARIQSEEGDDAVRIVRDASGLSRDIWIRWHPVENFSQSGPKDRHFVLEPVSGHVHFGDGRKGKIPPAGANNLRVRRYRAGGGSRGNVAAHAITVPRTTMAYVSSVDNLVAATGGADVEPIAHMVKRGSSWLRHRDRAVTAQDYEDLAASVANIARATCLPLRDLTKDPNGEHINPGWVSVIVVPEAGSSAPRPTLGQLRSVEEFLIARTPPRLNLAVVGPEYVSIDVTAEIVCQIDDDFGELTGSCQQRLRDYLNPLTGGSKGSGWSFGERPTQSALNAVLQHVEGVAQIKSLAIHAREERPGLIKSHLYLVCSGHHHITCVAAIQASQDELT